MKLNKQQTIKLHLKGKMTGSYVYGKPTIDSDINLFIKKSDFINIFDEAVMDLIFPYSNFEKIEYLTAIFKNKDYKIFICKDSETFNIIKETTKLLKKKFQSRLNPNHPFLTNKSFRVITSAMIIRLISKYKV